MNKQEKNRKNSLKNQSMNLQGFIINKKRVFIILIFMAVALTAFGLMATTINTKSGASDASGTFTVDRRDLTVTVTEAGSIRARNSIEYKCQVERRSQTLILSLVPAGTYVSQEDVNKGMVLVELDSSTLRDNLTQEEMELAGDQESYTAATESYNIRVKQNESDIADAEMTVRFARMDLEKYLGDEIAQQLIKDVNEASNLSEYIAPIIAQVREDPNILKGSAASQQFKRLQDDIILAKGNLATAEATLAGTIKLHDSNYVSDLDLEKDKLIVMNRRFSAESAEVAIDLFLRYDLPKDAEQYLSNYIESKRSLDRTYAECRSRLAQAQATLSMAEQRLNRQQERVDDLRQQIEYCTIRAKAPGLVTYGESGEGDRFRRMRGAGIIAEGESVTEGQTIISMPNTAEMVAEISVHETEVDKVRPGQPATIVMDAFPDKVLRGKVIEVAPLPDEQRGWLNPDLKVYKTLVLLEGTHDFLKTRMSCRVTIFVEQRKDVLAVPIQVVANRGGEKVCYVMTADGPQERQVQTGIFNDMFVQIIDGLHEGDHVMMNPPQLIASSTELAMSAEQQELLASAAQNQSENAIDPSGEGGDRNESQARAERRRGQRGMDMGMGMPDVNSMPAEALDRIMAMLQQREPEKYQQLQKLRSEDEAKFKVELQKQMEEAMKRFQQGGFQRGGFPGGQEGQDGEQRQRRFRRDDGQQGGGGFQRQGSAADDGG